MWTGKMRDETTLFATSDEPRNGVGLIAICEAAAAILSNLAFVVDGPYTAPAIAPICIGFIAVMLMIRLASGLRVRSSIWALAIAAVPLAFYCYELYDVSQFGDWPAGVDY